jgi:hypothetical protein
VVDRVRSTAVRLLGCDAALQGPSATDPVWLQMAARDEPRRGRSDPAVVERRRLRRRRACGNASGTPLLGALVFETAGTLVGIDNPEPTSILDQLEGAA